MSTALATWINGPVLRARPDGAFRLREAVTVGEQRLLGEVIRVATDSITVQLYEDTSGLRPGVLVNGSGRLLSIRVGPGSSRASSTVCCGPSATPSTPM
jgi:V/A-type H+/Na+-transporting ATPase subunit A